MSLTHSIPDSLTLHCCWKTQTCVFCIHNVWLQSIRWWCQRNLASPQGQGGLKKRESPCCQAFYSSLKTDYLYKVTDVFNSFLNGLTLVPGIATITRVQASPLVVCKMMITIACITCSVITLCFKFTFKECLTSNAVPYLETISTQRRVRKVRRTRFK